MSDVEDPTEGAPSDHALLPPQMLLLVLETGDTVFLYLRTDSDGALAWAQVVYESSRKDLLSYPGFHVAVDPSSRYLALGGPDKSFEIHELESFQQLNEQSRRDEPLSPVKSYRLRSVQGVIHKMVFLHPRPGDDHHIILLLIMVKNGRSKLVTYEWELGDNLRDVFAEEKKGIGMPSEHQMPLLVIPLKVCSAFMFVSEEQIVICTDLLHGAPEWVGFDVSLRPATTNYHGRNQPLWTAWARPYRLADWLRYNDCVFLAREDGLVYYLQVDSEGCPAESNYMDKFDCNISTAFACLYDVDSDILIMGGDSGPGAMYKFRPREDAIPLGTLPNWSPVVDMSTTDEFSTWNQEVGAAGTHMVPWTDSTPSRPDRVFCTSGRGAKGTVTEYRYGLQAKIGLEMECGLGVKQSWLLPARSSSLNAFDLLLSLPGQTVAVRLTEDLSQADENETESPYDESSRTLAAATARDMIIQVTEKFIVVVGDTFCSRSSFGTFDDIGSAFILDAAICNGVIAISTHHQDSRFAIHIFRIEHPARSVNLVQSFQVDAEVNCVSLCQHQDDTVELLAGLWQDRCPLLARAKIGGERFDDLEKFDPYTFSLLPNNGIDGSPASVEPIDSVASCLHDSGQVIVAGFRNGEVSTILLDTTGILVWQRTERLGSSTARVCVASEPGASPMLLVTIDSRLLLIASTDAPTILHDGVAGVKHQIWPVDASNPGAQCPAVDAVTVLPRNLLSDRDGTISLLLLSGPRVLFSELCLKPGPAHRPIPVDGTPTRVMYSHHLKCLVVAVTRNDQPALMFVDPDTGEDLSKPTDNHGAAVPYIKGLGKTGDKIYGLSDWEFKIDNSVWRFLIVAIGQGERGEVIVVSAEKETATGAQNGATPKIRYRTRFRRKGLVRPVYAVLGFEDFVIYCTGRKIVWEILDRNDRKLKSIDSYELDSPATSLKMVNGKLVALTNSHSLEVIEPPRVTGIETTATCKLLHTEARHRHTVHMIEVGTKSQLDPATSLMLVSDRDCGVTGLWVPWQVPEKDLQVIFEADLKASIRTFRRGRTRPFWEQDARRPRYGRIAMTIDDAEILGVSLDGSMHQFTLLTREITHVLRFIQNLAFTDKQIYAFSIPQRGINEMTEFDPEPTLRPDSMHVDGDVLQQVYDKKALERLVATPSTLSRLRELLDEVEGGEYTLDIPVDGLDVAERYYKLAYRILEYFLAPIL
ncbi:hypothetical protein DL546_008353 [Coniochaeta pulveracea]|nr:hypothetical protein DL546_008353 [Coniochaeta pulveracea]